MIRRWWSRRRRRWAVVLVLPPIPDVCGYIRVPMVKGLTEAEADARVVEVLAWPNVADAVLFEGGWVEVDRVDRLGFVEQRERAL